jgi:hypothetical protein
MGEERTKVQTLLYNRYVKPNQSAIQRQEAREKVTNRITENAFPAYHAMRDSTSPALILLLAGAGFPGLALHPETAPQHKSRTGFNKDNWE